MKEIKRETWASKIGFVIACAGAAIGLGNVWMFPWRLGSYGGAAFLIIYLFFIFIFATTGLVEEFALGRSTQRGAIGAFERVFSEKGAKRLGVVLGVLPVIACYAVLVFYLVVIGWVIKWFTLSVGGLFGALEMPKYFGTFVGSPASIPWHLIGVIITGVIVAFGIQKGIERANKIMLPILFILMILVMIRSVTLPGARKGFGFMLLPEWSKMLNPITWVMALGQAYFTVSLAGANMVVYGSYLSKDQDLPKSAFQTAGLNTIISLIAACIVIPAAFAFGIEPSAGPSLLFITLPEIFPQMPGGYIFGIIFFLGMIFVVISSSIALMEIPVEALMDRLKLSRKKAVIISAVVTWVLGLPLALSMKIFGLWADIASIYLVPLGAVLAAITFFWIYGIEKAREEIRTGQTSNIFRSRWFPYFGKYGFVGVSILVLVLGIIYKGI